MSRCSPTTKGEHVELSQFPFFNVLRRCDQGLHGNPFFSEFPALDLGSHNFVTQKNCVIYGEVFNSLHFYNLPPYVYTQFTLFVLFVNPAY